ILKFANPVFMGAGITALAQAWVEGLRSAVGMMLPAKGSRRYRLEFNAETVLIDCEVVRNRAKVEKEFATLSCAVHVAMAIRSLADESRCLSLMSRYEARHQRTHDKAYAALRELQKSRASQPTPPEPEPAPAAAP